MKNIHFSFWVLLVCIFSAFQFSTTENTKIAKYRNFKRGEKLTYLAHYSFLHAGVATVYMLSLIHI